MHIFSVHDERPASKQWVCFLESKSSNDNKYQNFSSSFLFFSVYKYRKKYIVKSNRLKCWEARRRENTPIAFFFYLQTTEMTWYYFSPTVALKPYRVFLRSMAIVIGPTPPGTGEIYPAFSLAFSNSTSPAR